jgi:hypothetical protein
MLGLLLPLVPGVVIASFLYRRRAVQRRKAVLELAGLDDSQSSIIADVHVFGISTAPAMHPTTESAVTKDSSTHVDSDSALLQHDHQQPLQL